VKQGLDIIPVKWINEVLQVALQTMPEVKVSTDNNEERRSNDETSFHQTSSSNHH